MRRLFVFTATLVLLGGGCAGTTSVQTTPTAATSTTSESPAEPTTSTEEAVALPAVTIEDPAASDAEVVVDTASEPIAISMIADNFSFSPTTITATPGQVVNVTISSNSGFHTLVIDEIGLKETTKTGGVISFTAPTTPGSYPFYCDVGSHQSLGMEGTLIVK